MNKRILAKTLFIDVMLNKTIVYLRLMLFTNHFNSLDSNATGKSLSNNLNKMCYSINSLILVVSDFTYLYFQQKHLHVNCLSDQFGISSSFSAFSFDSSLKEFLLSLLEKRKI